MGFFEGILSPLFGFGGEDKASQESTKKFDFLPGIFGGTLGAEPDFGASAGLAELVKAQLLQQLPTVPLGPATRTNQTRSISARLPPKLAQLLQQLPTSPFRTNQTRSIGLPGGAQPVPSRVGAPVPSRVGAQTPRLPTQTLGGVAPVSSPSRATSAFQDPLQQALLNPQFGANTASEQALLKSIGEQTQGASALRGLGPATQASLAQNLAPALIGLRQQNISNLSGALQQDIGSQISQRGQDVGFGLGQRQQDVTQRGQDITQRAQQIAQQQSAVAQLMQLAQLAQPQAFVTGENIQSVSKPSIISRFTDLLGAL